MPIVIQPGLRVEFAAGVEGDVGVARFAAGVGPGGVVDGDHAVGGVDVTLQRVAGGVQQGRDVEVGVVQEVQPVVVAQAVEAGVLVAQDGRVNLAPAPDVLVLGLQGLGLGR